MMKNNRKKARKLVIIVLVFMGVFIGCGCSKQKTVDNEKKEPVTQNVTTQTENQGDEGITLIPKKAEDFYRSAYNGEFDKMKSYMTEEFATEFEKIQNESEDSQDYNGAYKLLTLNQLTDVESPVETESPVVLSDETQYSVRLKLSDQQSAYVCFQKTGNDYKVSGFDIDIVSKGKGGYMGSGYKE